MNSDTKNEPIAVLISDIHFNINTISLASKALKVALSRAEALKVPLIVAGDLHDHKAIIRAEVANVLCEIFKHARTSCYILVGNHDFINEKSDEHGLNYLRPYASIIDSPSIIQNGLYLIPYYHDLEDLRKELSTIESDNILIMHQGFQGAAMGDYVIDKTSISTDLVKDFTVFSGHYHRHQTIGTVTYIGNPYTLSFGEANDGPKGFLILNSDGSYIREILDLRKHIILELDTSVINDLESDFRTNTQDLIWVKLKGNMFELKQISKSAMGYHLFGHNNYRLDLVANDSQTVELQDQNLTNIEIFDKIIEALGESKEQHQYLKDLYREIIEN